MALTDDWRWRFPSKYFSYGGGFRVNPPGGFRARGFSTFFSPRDVSERRAILTVPPAPSRLQYGYRVPVRVQYRVPGTTTSNEHTSNRLPGTMTDYIVSLFTNENYVIVTING